MKVQRQSKLSEHGYAMVPRNATTKNWVKELEEWCEGIYGEDEVHLDRKFLHRVEFADNKRIFTGYETVSEFKVKVMDQMKRGYEPRLILSVKYI